ncbi:MAG: adenosylmethionine--8-amino-7-oxononanoate transaminase, partial [Synechococcaceae cyanobacterium SM2_3_1]|nr:adenosylmethionine--8-amino-7-oxononanoate transaminase [Synechococcaceae cyanobacterium SM2_3_1]
PFHRPNYLLTPETLSEERGIWIELEDGRRIMDCISSWWVNLHGHCHPKISEAIYKQSQQLEHIIFAGFTHDPAERLAEELVGKLPENLTRTFYSDDGSTAVEVALKMAYQYWHNRDQPRTNFIAFEGAYHGDTFGAMSVGSRSIFSQVYADLLFEVKYVPFPDTYQGDPDVQEQEERTLWQLEKILSVDPNCCAGIIIEPLVQGAGGMRMCRPLFLQKIVQLAKAYDTLLIFDEVMTGFGRTGDWFAALRAQVSPDIICLSKGITGGFLPLAVTVCTEQIYEAFYSDDLLKTLFHGHSYTANPLGCAAGLASLEILTENQASFKSMEMIHQRCYEHYLDHERISHWRVTGTIAAMDVKTPEASGYLNQVGLEIRKRSLEQGLLLRPLGNVLYVMPPYCTTEDELVRIYQGINQILREIVAS